MKTANLYQLIAEAIRADILSGRYRPGDRLPSVRQLCEKWNCTPGTVQRAYQELSREGLLVSRAGQGTQVASAISSTQAQGQAMLRRANLVNRLEAVLLELLTAGYTPEEIPPALDVALDRWRAVGALPEESAAEVVRFAGSHDWAVSALAQIFFGRVAPGIHMQIAYTGSLGGLIALAEGKADLAGSHLWDQETDSYNLPFVHRLLPGKEVTVVTLAHRRQGLIVAPGNPLSIHQLADLARPGLRFVNRQSGSGTRVWLDAMLAQQKIDPQKITGYADERLTHSDVARAVAAGSADVGLGLEAAGQAFGLDFVFLHRERYDLVIPTAALSENTHFQQLLNWLASDAGKQLVAGIPGYEHSETGCIQQ